MKNEDTNRLLSASWVGTLWATVTISDGITTVTGGVSLIVTADPSSVSRPEITAHNDTFVWFGDQSPVAGNVLTNDELHSPEGPVTVSLNAEPQYGTVALNSDGTFTYTA